MQSHHIVSRHVHECVCVCVNHRASLAGMNRINKKQQQHTAFDIFVCCIKECSVVPKPRFCHRGNPTNKLECRPADSRTVQYSGGTSGTTGAQVLSAQKCHKPSLEDTEFRVSKGHNDKLLASIPIHIPGFGHEAAKEDGLTFSARSYILVNTKRLSAQQERAHMCVFTGG